MNKTLLLQKTYNNIVSSQTIQDGESFQHKIFELDQFFKTVSQKYGFDYSGDKIFVKGQQFFDQSLLNSINELAVSKPLAQSKPGRKMVVDSGLYRDGLEYYANSFLFFYDKSNGFSQFDMIKNPKEVAVRFRNRAVNHINFFRKNFGLPPVKQVKKVVPKNGAQVDDQFLVSFRGLNPESFADWVLYCLFNRLYRSSDELLMKSGLFKQGEPVLVYWFNVLGFDCLKDNFSAYTFLRYKYENILQII